MYISFSYSYNSFSYSIGYHRLAIRRCWSSLSSTYPYYSFTKPYIYPCPDPYFFSFLLFLSALSRSNVPTSIKSTVLLSMAKRSITVVSSVCSSKLKMLSKYKKGFMINYLGISLLDCPKTCSNKNNSLCSVLGICLFFNT